MLLRMMRYFLLSVILGELAMTVVEPYNLLVGASGAHPLS